MDSLSLQNDESGGLEKLLKLLNHPDAQLDLDLELVVALIREVSASASQIERLSQVLTLTCESLYAQATVLPEGTSLPSAVSSSSLKMKIRKREKPENLPEETTSSPPEIKISRRYG